MLQCGHTPWPGLVVGAVIAAAAAAGQVLDAAISPAVGKGHAGILVVGADLAVGDVGGGALLCFLRGYSMNTAERVLFRSARRASSPGNRLQVWSPSAFLRRRTALPASGSRAQSGRSPGSRSPFGRADPRPGELGEIGGPHVEGPEHVVGVRPLALLPRALPAGFQVRDPVPAMSQCPSRVRARCHIEVLGNHDEALDPILLRESLEIGHVPALLFPGRCEWRTVKAPIKADLQSVLCRVLKGGAWSARAAGARGRPELAA